MQECQPLFLDIGTVNDASRVVNSFRIIGEDLWCGRC